MMIIKRHKYSHYYQAMDRAHLGGSRHGQGSPIILFSAEENFGTITVSRGP